MVTGTLRQWLARLVGHGAAVEFESSSDPTLVAFGELFADSGLTAFATGRQPRGDAYTESYDCWTESIREAGDAPERFTVTWTPVPQGTDPLTGFRTGEDSILLGTAPTVAMPQDERTDALLLLVSGEFIQLWAEQGDPGSAVHGVVDTGEGYRFLSLP
jgi:hypothetical protein